MPANMALTRGNKGEHILQEQYQAKLEDIQDISAARRMDTQGEELEVTPADNLLLRLAWPTGNVQVHSAGIPNCSMTSSPQMMSISGMARTKAPTHGGAESEITSLDGVICSSP